MIVNGFDDKVLVDWMIRVKKGLEGDWTELIEHCMHFLTLGPFGKAKDVKQPLFLNAMLPRIPPTQRQCMFPPPYATPYP